MLLNSTALAALALAAPTPVMGDDVAVSAGTIHLVDQGRVLTGGGTILVRDGRIVTVGNDVALPPGITRVDYGPDAVIVPGFVAADSSLADGAPAPRTVAPELDAIDGFDFYASLTSAVASGVTSAYVTPARDRLIAGRGAVISLGSGDPAERVLGAGLTIHGAISAEARSTPGYWEPPIPATSDVGLGVPENQLPRTTMGAILALDQLLAGVDAGEELDAFGPTAVASLKSLMDGGAAWRITAVEEHEIRALVEFADEHDLRLIVDGAHYAGDLGQELAGVGAHVIYESPFAPSGGGGDQGQLVTLGNGMTVLIGGGSGGSGGDDVGDAEMPDLDVPARLAASGVPIAITPARGSSLRDLRFAASLASRGGLDPATALAAITIEPARMYGVADQIGSIAPGKRADFVVMNGSPLEPGASVRATWIGGEKAWSPNSGDHAMTVVSVDELHLGDGRVHEPGEI
ncbi:MAG: amidohydrolase family protein, partial [Planctomycetota bacterium]